MANRLIAIAIAANRLIAIGVAALFVCACGSAPPPPREPTSTDARHGRSTPDAESATIDAEIGGLDEDAVQQVFAKAGPAIGECIGRGAERLRFLAGELKVALKIAADGSVKEGLVTRSSYGDRATEKCILASLTTRRWPKPVGGRTGLTTHTLDSAPSGAAATVQDAFRLGPSLEKLLAALDTCKGAATSAKLTVTVYVDENGKPLSAGAAASDGTLIEALDCAVEAALALEYAAPALAPAKTAVTR